MKLSKIVQFLLTFLLLSVVVEPLFASGNKELPDIPLITSESQYFSPDSNGVKDTATLSFSVTVFVKSDEGYAPEYGLQILDSTGNIMKEVVETEKSDIGWFSSIFRGYSKFSLDRSISWDGTNKTGDTVSDGVYNVKLWVVDSSKNRKELDVDNFVVDTRKPEAIIVKPLDLILSPNGDNSMDTIEISHTQASKEAFWVATIMDDRGNVVKSLSWENGIPSKVVWDGLDDSDVPVPAGTYSYTLSSKDEAGNESESIVLEGIVLDLTVTPIAILIDNPSISPDGNGVKDSLIVYLELHETKGIESWDWQIRHEDSTVYWQVLGDRSLPGEVYFDGTDSKGDPMPEGTYSFIYNVYYKNGNKPTALESFIIDVTSPNISVSVTNPLFSPNGDGLKDQVEFRFKSDEKVIWEGAILDNHGSKIVSASSNKTSSVIVWSGMDIDGSEAPDGIYSVVATFTDSAGNSTLMDPSFLNVNRVPIDISLKTIKSFSPNSDGSRDDFVVIVDSSQYDGLDNWRLDILDRNGHIIRDIQGFNMLPPEIVWDGTVIGEDGATSTAEEGSYSAKLYALYQNGDIVEAVSDRFSLDITPPEISIDVVYNPFVVTEKGLEGEVYVTLKVLDNTEVTHWSMDVLNTGGNILRSYSGKGNPSGEITWNSRELNGGTTPSHDNPNFVLRLTVFDTGSNESVFKKVIPLDILLVIKDGKKYISVPNIIFGAYQHKLDSAGASQLVANNRSLDRVVAIYQKYPTYGLVLEGHSLNIYLGGPRENREEKILLPLTARRADAVRDALIKRGMPSSKISTKPFGGQLPIVSVSDKTVWWKNRRVEFVMTDPAE